MSDRVLTARVEMRRAHNLIVDGVEGRAYKGRFAHVALEAVHVPVVLVRAYDSEMRKTHTHNHISQ